MEWTDIRLTVAKADAENAEAVAALIAEVLHPYRSVLGKGSVFIH